MHRPALPPILGFITTFALSLPAQAPLAPLTVCEVLRELPANEGKSLPVLGRYSYRETGRVLGEQACEAGVAERTQLALVEDPGGPTLPDAFAIDGAVLSRKFTELRKRTALGKFRFGSADYDRWAVIYGRVESPGGGKAPSLVFRGNGVVVFLGADR